MSGPVQFWSFHMSGLRADLYNSLPPGVAQPMFARLLNDSLGVLAVRYCQVNLLLHSLTYFWPYILTADPFQINPCPRRLDQYRADITTILVSCTFCISCMGHLRKRETCSLQIGPGRKEEKAG